MENKLTLEEKIFLVSGKNFMYTYPVQRLNIPSLSMADGPHGLRKQLGGVSTEGMPQSEMATAFPTASLTACGWNEENLYKMGQAIAKECKHYGVNILLGPGINIKRNPLGGRCFEYFSEDPYLSGKMGIAEVKGIQENGVGVSLKHFALNNQETFRMLGNSICDMRAMREIYLKAFEMVVKEAKPKTIMCAYNQINGSFCSENKELLTDILREEWGFDGVVMTDWGATHKRVEGIKAGLDLEMPGDTRICRRWLFEAVKNGELEEKQLDVSVNRMLKLIDELKEQKKEEVDFEEHHMLSAEIAQDCAVLLKNEGVLPLDKKEKIIVIGELFGKMRYQGAGSSMINPTKLTTPKEIFDKNKIDYTYIGGYSESELDSEPELLSSLDLLKDKNEKVLIFAGLTDYIECESIDRENMELPKNQLDVIEKACLLSDNVIVVLFGGSVIELPFESKVKGILNMSLPGQNGGLATYNLLYGIANPSGKLAQTWMKKYEDVPFYDEYSKGVNELYKESIFVGYRYYDTFNKDVLYPFGYGLSYTSFKYENMAISVDDDTITISCDITNTGAFEGGEAVQLYVAAPETDVFKPSKELRAFTKVYLKPNETKRAVMCLKIKDLSYYNIKENRWILEDGDYTLCISSSSRDVRLSQKIKIDGEVSISPYSKSVNEAYKALEADKITNEVFTEMSGKEIPPPRPKKPITIESHFHDLRERLFGKLIYSIAIGFLNRKVKKAKKLPKGALRDNKVKGALFIKRIFETNSIIGMTMSGGDLFQYNRAMAVVHLSNGRIIKGIKSFFSKIKFYDR